MVHLKSLSSCGWSTPIQGKVTWCKQTHAVTFLTSRFQVHTYLYFWLEICFHEPTAPNASGLLAPVCGRNTWSLVLRMRWTAEAVRKECSQNTVQCPWPSPILITNWMKTDVSKFHIPGRKTSEIKLVPRALVVVAHKKSEAEISPRFDLKNQPMADTSRIFVVLSDIWQLAGKKKRTTFEMRAHFWKITQLMVPVGVMIK